MSRTEPPTYAFGRFRLEGLDGRLTLAGREITLPPRERQLLAIFVEHADQWLRDEWLLHALWPKAVPGGEELDHLVRSLATFLDAGADGVATIQTAAGRGRRLAMPVSEAAPGVAAAPRANARRAATNDDTATGSGSARRRILSPGRFALLLFVAAAVAVVLGIALRWATRRADDLPHAKINLDDPVTVRAAASAELAKGVAASRGFDRASIDESVARFEDAKAIEPGFAEARAALALALVRRGEMACARREAEVARVLAPDLANAHAALAFTRLFAEWNPATAREAAERAIALDAVAVAGRRAFAWTFAAEGRFDEALDQLRRVAPVGATDPELVADEARILYFAGRRLEARQLASRVLREEPVLAPMRGVLARIHLQERRLAAAAVEFELRDRLRAGAGAGDERIRQSLIGALEPPDAGEAARLLRARAETIPSDPSASPDAAMDAARIYAQFDDREPALAALDKAIVRREGDVVLAWVDPALAPIRGTPRFRELLARAAVPPPPAPSATSATPP